LVTFRTPLCDGGGSGSGGGGDDGGDGGDVCDSCEDGEDPITLMPLGAGGERVVRLPCGDASAARCVFNETTLVRALRVQPRCPACGTHYAQLRGPQPSGTMSVARQTDVHCEGHGGVGTLVVSFVFPSGVQGAQHPRPRERYHGTTRYGFYPDNELGAQCVRMLQAAFEHGVAFRVGTSATTGQEDTVVYGVHQKSCADGGAERHGWPDATYLERLRSECAAFDLFLESVPPLALRRAS
jgi:deltex-like protein